MRSAASVRLHALRREAAIVGAEDQLLLGARRVGLAGEDRVVDRVRAGDRAREQAVEVALPDEAVDLAPRAVELWRYATVSTRVVRPEVDPVGRAHPPVVPVHLVELGCRRSGAAASPRSRRR